MKLANLDPPAWLASMLCCLSCGDTPLQRTESALQCSQCSTKLPVVGGIVDALITASAPPTIDKAYEGWGGKVYAAFMDRPWCQRLDAWLLGMDVRRYYTEMEGVLAEITSGPILELPAGGAPFASRASAYRTRGPWIFADLSWTMLTRVQRRCQELGLLDVAFIRVDARQLPFRASSLATIFSPFGFHCFHDKAAVFEQISRCLKPGGRLVGSALTEDGPARSRFYLGLNQRDGTFAHDNSIDLLKEHAEHQALTLDVRRQLGAAIVFEAGHAQTA